MKERCYSCGGLMNQCSCGEWISVSCNFCFNCGQPNNPNKSDRDSITPACFIQAKDTPKSVNGSDNIHTEIKKEMEKNYTILGEDICSNCYHQRLAHGKAGCHYSLCKCTKFALDGRKVTE